MHSTGNWNFGNAFNEQKDSLSGSREALITPESQSTNIHKAPKIKRKYSKQYPAELKYKSPTEAEPGTPKK